MEEDSSRQLVLFVGFN